MIEETLEVKNPESLFSPESKILVMAGAEFPKIAVDSDSGEIYAEAHSLCGLITNLKEKGFQV